MVEEKTSDLFEKIKSSLPSKAKISDIKYEGCEIVLYTKDKDFFISDPKEIKDLVSSLKKRIILRPDPSICLDDETAAEEIKKIVPEEAGLQDLDFEPDFGTVTIEANKPGLIIGKGGETLKEIKKRILWFPIVKRTPSIPSDIVKGIKTLLSEKSF